MFGTLGIIIALKLSNWETHSIELAAESIRHDHDEGVTASKYLKPPEAKPPAPGIKHESYTRGFAYDTSEEKSSSLSGSKSRDEQYYVHNDERSDSDQDSEENDGEDEEEAARDNPSIDSYASTGDVHELEGDEEVDETQNSDSTEFGQEEVDSANLKDEAIGNETKSNDSILPLNGQSVTNVTDQQLQTVKSGEISPAITEAHEEAHEKPLRIALLGERNSGTRWMSQVLGDCFPTLDVQPRLIRWKHWFQHDMKHSNGTDREPTLVISQFRHIYQWIEAMRKTPHHAPMHLKKDWKTFVTTPWKVERPDRDIPYASNLGNALNPETNQTMEPQCHERFYYNQIISCIEGSRNDTNWKNYHGCDPKKDFSCHKPIYELKHHIDPTQATGEAYESIIHLRRDKILNHVVEVRNFPWVVQVIPVQYEQLLAEGTESLIGKVEDITGVLRSCNAPGSQTRPKRLVDLDLKRWLNENANWTVEALIDYSPESLPPIYDKNEQTNERRKNFDNTTLT